MALHGPDWHREGKGACLSVAKIELVAEIRASSADLKSEILKWMFSAMAVQTALLVTLIKLI